MPRGDEYRSKVAIHYLLLMVLMICVAVYYTYKMIIDQDLACLVMVAAMLSFPVFIAYSYFCIKYTFTEHFLLIEGGFKKRYEIGYSLITQTKETYNPNGFYSSYAALSLSQIMIKYVVGQTIYISPVRKREFLSKLETKISSSRITKEDADSMR